MPTNSWINHVKAYAKEHNLTYNCAISHAKSTYVKKTKDDKANEKLLEAQKLMRGHLKRLKTQYEEVKDDNYRLGLLKMKFNKMSQVLKDYIQKEDPDLFNKIKTVSRLKVN